MKKAIILLIALTLTLSVTFVPVGAKAAAYTPSVGTVTVSSGRLNVRSAASVGSSVLTSLNSGTYITLVSKSNDWWYVEYADGKFGYCHGDYITEIGSTSATVSISSGHLNIRSGADANHKKIGELKNGETVLIISSHGLWRRILYNGSEIGFVSSVYLSENTQKYDSITLSVPYYSQTDKRWASKTIGSSGKTIGKIGCATTGIAMIESYRRGFSVYPDTMSDELKYTSSGNVYWPSNYKPHTSGKNYLDNIYTQLKLGKPVLIGFKNKYGSQHWVVITGFKGGNELTESKFTVNDPGSRLRTDLKQIVDRYPQFYKYFIFTD